MICPTTLNILKCTNDIPKSNALTFYIVLPRLSQVDSYSDLRNLYKKLQILALKHIKQQNICSFLSILINSIYNKQNRQSFLSFTILRILVTIVDVLSKIKIVESRYLIQIETVLVGSSPYSYHSKLK